MNQAIIYLQDNGIVAVCTPTPEALQTMTIQEIAAKDVPKNKKYRIVDVADLPDAPQESWVINEADLTDGVGA